MRVPSAASAGTPPTREPSVDGTALELPDQQEKVLHARSPKARLPMSSASTSDAPRAPDPGRRRRHDPSDDRAARASGPREQSRGGTVDEYSSPPGASRSIPTATGSP